MVLNQAMADHKNLNLMIIDSWNINKKLKPTVWNKMEPIVLNKKDVSMAEKNWEKDVTNATNRQKISSIIQNKKR